MLTKVEISRQKWKKMGETKKMELEEEKVKLGEPEYGVMNMVMSIKESILEEVDRRLEDD